MRSILSLSLICLSLLTFGQKLSKYRMPAAPDYSDLKYWIAHPDTDDKADMVPGKGQLHDRQYSAHCDVFFIYPTIYTEAKYKDHPWFADVNDPVLNQKIAETTIQNQASVFNVAAHVYSPLYRQAHINAFYSDSTTMNDVLDLAYEDVKKAFEHYLENWHDNKPIIIASHSQGTVHAVKLLHEYFEGKPLMKKLVAAYIVGMPVQANEFDKIPMCSKEDDYGCWMTWNTFKKGYYPESHVVVFAKAACINPLSWSLDGAHVSHRENKGGVLRDYTKIIPKLCDAQVQAGMLWIKKPKFFGNFLLNWERYHTVDYNLFYMNVRNNVETRVKSHFSGMLVSQPASEVRD